MTSSCICKCHLDLCYTRTFWGFKQHLKSVSLKCLSKEETLNNKTDGFKWKEKIAVFSWHWNGFFLERCNSETSAFLSCLRTNFQVQCGVKSAANTSLHRRIILFNSCVSIEQSGYFCFLLLLLISMFLVVIFSDCLMRLFWLFINNVKREETAKFLIPGFKDQELFWRKIHQWFHR